MSPAECYNHRYLRVESARPALVGPDTGNVVPEVIREVHAGVVGERHVPAVAGPPGICADVDIAVAALRKSLREGIAGC